MPMPRKPGSGRTIRKALRSHRQPEAYAMLVILVLAMVWKVLGSL
jgi:hypothetical protein